MGGCISLGFFQLQKREINDKRGICVRRDVSLGGLVIIQDKAQWWGILGCDVIIEQPLPTGSTILLSIKHP